MNSLLSPLASKGNTFCTKETVTYNGSNDIRRKANAIGKSTESSWASSAAEAIINSCKSYSDALRQKRLEANNNALNVQKQKYHYKDMSSSIIRSKTSSSARQVVSQTKREIQRLKKAKLSGKYDEEEIDAAIAHAKAMERIARKKVRHLEEEEMAKASGKGKYEEFIDERIEKAEAEQAEVEQDETDMAEDDISDEISSETEELSEISEEMSEMSEEMMDEITASMDEALKEMGLEELSESLLAATGEMDEHDIKMMEINHRNKEMKDIVKANAEYLKAIFEHFESIKSAALPTGNVTPEAAAPPVSINVTV